MEVEVADRIVCASFVLTTCSYDGGRVLVSFITSEYGGGQVAIVGLLVDVGSM